jgi:predicted O-methyltransferase YrrM
MSRFETAPEKLWWDGTKPYDYDPPLALLQQCENLTDLADVFGSDKGNMRGHNYAKQYERLIDPSHIASLCEIGIACGASLKMWGQYLPNANITGIDIREDCASLCKNHPNINILIGDVLTMNHNKQFDVVIDDASHISEDIENFFHHCWSWVKPGGLYIVEDMLCTYSEKYKLDYNQQFGLNKENDRNRILHMMDTIMKSIDAKDDVESLEYHPQLLIIKKSSAVKTDLKSRIKNFFSL